MLNYQFYKIFNTKNKQLLRIKIMKKSALIVGIVGILAIGYTGSSWYFGSKIKHTVYETLPVVQQRLNDILADNDLFYDKEIQLVISE